MIKKKSLGFKGYHNLESNTNNFKQKRRRKMSLIPDAVFFGNPFSTLVRQIKCVFAKLKKRLEHNS